MAQPKMPSPEDLRKVIDYCPETGKMTWKVRSPDQFDAVARDPKDIAATWNKRFAGKPAFNSPTERGHLQGTVFGYHASAHRVAWAIHTGAWPTFDIDHLNGDPTDNRIDNMRDVTREINARNRRKNPRNTSGVNGVYRDKRRGTWYVSVVGLSKEQAITIRKYAEQMLGYHSDHGT